MQNPLVINILNKEGLENWYDAKVLVSNIDDIASLDNQARVADTGMEYRLRPDYVHWLATRMKAGFPFYALVGYLNVNKKIVLFDGNHRLAAHKEVGHQRVDVHIVNIQDAVMIKRLTFTLNLLESQLPVKEEDMKSHILRLTYECHYKEPAIAELLTISRSRVNFALRADEVTKRLLKLEFNRIPSLSDTQLNILARIQQDTALYAVAELAVKYEIKDQNLVDFASEVKGAASSEQAQAVVIKKTENIYKPLRRITKTGDTKLAVSINIPQRQFNIGLNLVNRYALKPESLDLNEITLAKIQKTIDILRSIQKNANKH